MLTAAVILTGVGTGCATFERVLPGTLSDAQVASVFQMLDQTDTQGALLAEQKASSPHVRDYARVLLKKHAVLSQDENTIRVSGEEPALSLAIEKADRDMLQKLSKKSGAAFDRAYIDYQLRRQRDAMDLAEGAAKFTDDVQLKEQLRDARLKFYSHLARANALHYLLSANSDTGSKHTHARSVCDGEIC
jgi:putative membrane protein